MPTKLTLRVSVSMAVIYCLYLLYALPRECSISSMANEQSFESFNVESLNTKMISIQIERERSKELVKL